MGYINHLKFNSNVEYENCFFLSSNKLYFIFFWENQVQKDYLELFRHSLSIK